MTPDKRYVVTIGMSIVPEGGEAFADFGIRYGDVPAGHLPIVESVVNNHKDGLLEALKPIIDDLTAIGLAQVEDGADPIKKK